MTIPSEWQTVPPAAGAAAMGWERCGLAGIQCRQAHGGDDDMDVCSLPAREVDCDDLSRSLSPVRPTRLEVEAAVRTIIASTGEDVLREGLIDTPGRVARAYDEWFGGYGLDPASLLDRVFSEAGGYDETILLRSIPLVSTCEHHLAPIVGVAHVAYRPNERVVGISKLARLVDAFARRLQLQERLTNQIAHAMDEALEPRGVAVVIEASHGCMSTRGVKQHGSSMVTKCWLGEFKTDAELRRDVMESVRDSRPQDFRS
jgi:GTP cyclohydrolase I